MRTDAQLVKIKRLLALFIFSLVFSGLTAFPLTWEIELISKILKSTSWSPDFLTDWILKVRDGLFETDAKFPFIAYGTDWLAFGHIAIALFFLLPLKDPIKHLEIIKMGLWICALVIPTAIICGTIRHIPNFWILIDSSFGIFGFLLLKYILVLIQRLDFPKLSLEVGPPSSLQ